MQRHEVNQAILGLFRDAAYLEVGVSHGTTFHQVQANRKVAVDPRFQFDLGAAVADPANRNCTYHQVTSDAYFTGLRPAGELFDVVYLDGLHTFDQTLRDLLHAVCCLTPGGVVIIDDVLPSSYAAALPDWNASIRFRELVGDADQSWMGDVYRLVFFIRDYMRDFSYATLRANHGQTVLWRARRAGSVPPLGVEAISRLGFADAIFGQDAFNFQDFDDIVAAIAAARRSPDQPQPA